MQAAGPEFLRLRAAVLGAPSPFQDLCLSEMCTRASNARRCSVLLMAWKYMRGDHITGRDLLLVNYAARRLGMKSVSVNTGEFLLKLKKTYKPRNAL